MGPGDFTFLFSSTIWELNSWPTMIWQLFSNLISYFHTTVNGSGFLVIKRNLAVPAIVLLFINYFVFKEISRRYEAWFYRSLYCLLFLIYHWYNMHQVSTCILLVFLFFFTLNRKFLKEFLFTLNRIL
jgi:hypothetical protein